MRTALRHLNEKSKNTAARKHNICKQKLKNGELIKAKTVTYGNILNAKECNEHRKEGLR